MRLVDTHCHLNLPDAFPDPRPAIEEARAQGVDRLIAIGIDLPSSERAVQLAEAHRGVFATVGVHPNSAEGYDASQLQQLERWLAHPKVLALGEIGLDYHWDFATPAQQRGALLDQLALAESTGAPVVFHCREAYRDLLDLLQTRAPHPWLLHCFAGDEEDARRATGLGCYFGIDGPITYPKADGLRAIAKTLPKDRLVIETDSPYLTPAPHRGKPNRPAFVSLVNAGLATCLGIEREECAALTTRNAERFFRMP